jgi:hypothetical protein
MTRSSSSRNPPSPLARTRQNTLSVPLILSLLLLATVVPACGTTAEKKATGAPAGVSVRQLTKLSGSVGHPVYWAGAERGSTYEWSRTKDGRVSIRYLPPGAKAGDPKPKFLTVGTYPQANAFAVLKATAKKQGVPTTKLRGGGLAFADKTRPTSVYLAYPAWDYQIEVYDPSPDRARRLVVSGKVVPLGIATAGHSGAKAASAAQLKARASRVGHSIYWAGSEPNRTYEVTETTGGSIYVRYLPAGVQVGDPRPDYLTVGTYPQPGALAELKASAAKSHAKTIELSGGGLASIDESKPTSVYVAYPGSDFQIEVYDPTPSRARELVASGSIAPVG